MPEAAEGDGLGIWKLDPVPAMVIIALGLGNLHLLPGLDRDSLAHAIVGLVDGRGFFGAELHLATLFVIIHIDVICTGIEDESQRPGRGIVYSTGSDGIITGFITVYAEIGKITVGLYVFPVDVDNGIAGYFQLIDRHAAGIIPKAVPLIQF